ncbi:hypothetical protein EZV73_14695 [Acidaminobacter sp. JC074]|uniref:hypothetical protein n=1 Tax=Acidaminobacter sp. JC074 TaxID=2530199 RepID=UPI001F0F1B36|nr:hypothetical protein [Acidaminobacter sp. JC074]MCH4888841.1 hypothetical protein [Acidaminobacter sp. JC074]
MKKKDLIFILLIIVAVISLSILLNPFKHSIQMDDQGNYISRYAWVSGQEWSELDLTDANYDSPEAFLKDVDDYVEIIGKELNRSEWINTNIKDGTLDNLIEIKFSSGRSEASGGGYFESETYVRPVILLNIDGFEGGRDNLIHELVHIIAPYTSSKTMSEGLACYINDHYSKYDKTFLFDGSVHLIVKENLEGKYGNLVDYLGNNANGSNKLYTSDKKRDILYYAFSDSFTTYIIENVGIEDYMRLYQSDFKDEDYIDALGSDRQTSIDRWQAYILDFE